MSRAVRVRVTGRVQGVWFRAWTQKTTQGLLLRGWVRTDPDGSVSGRVAGPEAKVETFVAALHSGPPNARVEAVETSEAEDDVGDGFEIRG